MLSSVLVVGGILLAIVLLTPNKVFEVEIEPADLAEEAFVETVSGRTLRWDESVYLYSEAARLRIGYEGYKTSEIELLTVGGPTKFLVSLVPLPGYLSILLTGDLDVDVSINGQVTEQLVDIELEAGSYTIEVSYQGVHLTSKSIEVKGLGQRDSMEFDLTQYGSSVSLSVIPADAMITLDDEFTATGRMEQGIPVGPHEVFIDHAWYQSAKVKFETKVGEPVELGTIELRPRPIRVSISTEPKSASILVDGQFVGESDMSFEVMPGRSYEILTIKPGHTERRFVLAAEIGQSVKRHFDFVQETIQTSIQINPAGNIWVNGIDVGAAPQKLNLYPGDIVEARVPGLVTQSTTLDLAQGREQGLDFQLFNPVEHAYRQAPQRETTKKGNLRLRKFPMMQFNKLVSENPSVYSNINLTRPFYMGTTEVTVEAFHQFRKTAQTGDKMPIAGVSWMDAVLFCNWLSTEEGLDPVYILRRSSRILAQVNTEALGYRLPSEIEWEAAASYDWRTEVEREPYEWGKNPEIPIAYGNISGRERAQMSSSYLMTYSDNHEGLAPVASYNPNVNGLFDLTGNVSEWVHDLFDPRRPTHLAPDHFDTRLGLSRTIKGSNYKTSDLEEVTVHHREFEDTTREVVGFRVARWIY